MITADMGCGGKSRGYVNIDRYYGDLSPDTAQVIDPKDISNFIIGDVCHIPLKDNSCDLSVYHVIEHILEVNDAVRELYRVCKNKVVVAVPNHPMVKEHHTHLHSWSKSSLKSYLSCFFEDVDVTIKTTKYLKLVYKLVSLIPVFFLRRKAYQTIANFVGFELIAVCRKGVKQNDS